MSDTNIDRDLIVFTDLDGTLLDDAYSWSAAEPALARLRALNIPLILSSSKTLDEMITIASELDTGMPIIAENGAIIAYPKDSAIPVEGADMDANGSYVVEFTGLRRSDILEIVHGLRDSNSYNFEGFDDWTPERVCAETGLDRDQADRSMNRLATEPIHWLDTDERWNEFEKAITSRGLRAVRGGRFTHLMGQVDKAIAMSEVRKKIVANKAIALGDSPNDLDMLSAADIAIVIPNPRHPSAMAPSAPRVIHAEHPGPIGWNAAMMGLLHETYGTE